MKGLSLASSNQPSCDEHRFAWLRDCRRPARVEVREISLWRRLSLGRCTVGMIMVVALVLELRLEQGSRCDYAGKIPLGEGYAGLGILTTLPTPVSTQPAPISIPTQYPCPQLAPLAADVATPPTKGVKKALQNHTTIPSPNPFQPCRLNCALNISPPAAAHHANPNPTLSQHYQ